MSNPTRGLQREITLRLGARLVQEGNRLHYLADRASITGKFSDIECRKLDETFPHFIRQMESMLTTGELSPHHAHCVTLYPATGRNLSADSRHWRQNRPGLGDETEFSLWLLADGKTGSSNESHHPQSRSRNLA